MTTNSLLDGLEGCTLQLRIWGYAVQGDVGDVSVLVSEGYAHLTPRPAWDGTARDLDTQQVGYADEPYRRVKDHAALPWVMEHALRGHVEWPGL